jgi:hypothetical protein
MQMVLGLAKDVEDTLTFLYVGYDYSAAKRAVTDANPFLGFVFKETFPPAITIRGSTSTSEPAPSIQSVVMDGHTSALVLGTP